MTTRTTRRLDDAELAAYERDGFVPLGRIADERQVADLLEAERRFRPDGGYALPGTESRLLVREQLCHRSAAVRAMCVGGAHVGVLTQLLGPDVAFTHTQFITKLPDGTDVESWIPLHQDDGYGTLEPPLDVTVWMALVDTDERNGCLVVVPGSHRDGLRRHHSTDVNPLLLEADAEGAVALPLAAGEAVAFSGLTLHGSGPNHTTEPRVGMHMRYCHPSVRMLVEGGKSVLEDEHSWMIAGEAARD